MNDIKYSALTDGNDVVLICKIDCMYYWKPKGHWIPMWLTEKQVEEKMEMYNAEWFDSEKKARKYARSRQIAI